jgi:predicted kinase
VPFGEREAIAALVRWHMVPLFLHECRDAQRRVVTVSQTARCDHLALLARADLRGRRATDTNALLERVAFFRDFCAEEGCLEAPRRFASDHARFLYFRGERQSPDDEAYDDTRCEATFMSGLPGAGKSTWVREHMADAPRIPLDDIRDELGVAPTDDQSRVGNAARGRARDLLRAQQDFVWDATNLTRALRGTLIGLCRKYHALVRIVYVERPWADVLAHNRTRAAPIPEEDFVRLVGKLEVPGVTEAHVLVAAVRDA